MFVRCGLVILISKFIVCLRCKTMCRWVCNTVPVNCLVEKEVLDSGELGLGNGFKPAPSLYSINQTTSYPTSTNWLLFDLILLELRTSLEFPLDIVP